MKPVILVTAIGTITATTIVVEIKKTDAYYIIGTDINPANQIATSKDVDEFYVFPSSISDRESYFEYVYTFCKSKKINFYFAVIDEEVVNIAMHAKEFADIGTRLCIPDYNFVKVCHYKDVFNKWVSENMSRLAIKVFDNIKYLKKKDFPLFVKPIEGRASNGCKKISTFQQLQDYVDEYGSSEYIIQEFIEGEIITVDLARNSLTGQKTQIQRVELLRNANGCGIAVEIIENKKLTEICDELMTLLNLHGVVNAEFFHFQNEFKIIEINPRFSAGTSFSCMAGCNLPQNAIYIADGKQCVFPKILSGQRFAKRYETYRMDEESEE